MTHGRPIQSPSLGLKPSIAFLLPSFEVGVSYPNLLLDSKKSDTEQLPEETPSR